MTPHSISSRQLLCLDSCTWVRRSWPPNSRGCQSGRGSEGKATVVELKKSWMESRQDWRLHPGLTSLSHSSPWDDARLTIPALQTGKLRPGEWRRAEVRTWPVYLVIVRSPLVIEVKLVGQISDAMRSPNQRTHLGQAPALRHPAVGTWPTSSSNPPPTLVRSRGGCQDAASASLCPGINAISFHRRKP